MPEDEEDERIYTIPLRKTRNVPRPRRAPHAIREIKRYIAKHMKTEVDSVWIHPPVNEFIWSRGIESPPLKIRLKAKRIEEEGAIEVTLPED